MTATQSNTSQKIPPGVRRVRRKAASAKNHLEDMERRFEMELHKNPTGSKAKNRDVEVRRMADLRMRIYETLEEVIEEILQAQRGEIQLSKKKLEALKEKKTSLYSVLASHPELGYTEQEWEEAQSMLMRRIGRPKLSLEQRLIRARKDFNAKLEEMRSIESEHGVDSIAVEELDQYKSSARTGRPPRDRLDYLDAEIRRMERKIKTIRNEPEKEQPATGRKPISKEEKIKKCQNKIDQLQRQVDKAVSKLNKEDKLKRELKVARREANEIRQELRDGEISVYSTRAKRLQKLEDQIIQVTEQLHDIERRKAKSKAEEQEIIDRQRNRIAVERARSKSFKDLKKELSTRNKEKAGSSKENSRIRAFR